MLLLLLLWLGAAFALICTFVWRLFLPLCWLRLLCQWIAFLPPPL